MEEILRFGAKAILYFLLGSVVLIAVGLIAPTFYWQEIGETLAGMWR
jgi:hypothetical protein